VTARRVMRALGFALGAGVDQAVDLPYGVDGVKRMADLLG
jgi:hypothetical protein